MANITGTQADAAAPTYLGRGDPADAEFARDVGAFLTSSRVYGPGTQGVRLGRHAGTARLYASYWAPKRRANVGSS